MNIPHWVIWFLDNFGVLLSILGAIAGAIIGVILSQVLSLYRSDRETLERFEGVLRRIEIVIDEGQSGHAREAQLESIERDLRDIYSEGWWLFTQEGNDLLHDCLKKISKSTHFKADDPDVYVRTDDRMDMISLTSYLSEFAKDIEEHRFEVTLRGAWRRYRGKREPYKLSR